MPISLLKEVDIELPIDHFHSGDQFEIPLKVLEDLFLDFPDADILIPLGKNIGHHFPVYYRGNFREPPRRFDITDEIEGDLVKLEFQVVKRSDDRSAIQR
ncbi:MAG: hypothetical protein ACMUHY_03820 [Thermoplasmatota archaeon]